MKIPKEVHDYLDRLTEKYPKIESIWVFGSRANDSFKKGSDWDFWIFSNKKILNLLKKNTFLKRVSRESRVDSFVVYNGENFENPWPDKEDGVQAPKEGMLSEWEWKKITPKKAKYKANILKSKKGSDGKKRFHIEQKVLNAFKVWGHEKRQPKWYCGFLDS